MEGKKLNKAIQQICNENSAGFDSQHGSYPTKTCSVNSHSQFLLLFQKALTAYGSYGVGSDTLYVTDGVRNSSEGQKDCPVTVTKGQFCVLNQEYPLCGKSYFVVHKAQKHYVIVIIYTIFMALRVYCIWVCSNTFTYLVEIVFYMMI